MIYQTQNVRKCGCVNTCTYEFDPRDGMFDDDDLMMAIKRCEKHEAEAKKAAAAERPDAGLLAAYQQEIVDALTRIEDAFAYLYPPQA